VTVAIPLLRRFLIHPLLVLSLSSCAPSLAKREKAIATAWRYSTIEWTPTAASQFHGKDKQGIEVHTPDATLPAHGFANGWWKPGQPARGMPYQWGGFDTPESFQSALAQGKYAGDIGSSEKQKLGDAGVSREACGIDCSGFISRCWDLPRPYSTKQLPSICWKLSSWDELKPGDILLNHRHVLLFKGWKIPGKELYAYEAGPFPVWRVNAAAMESDKLAKNGYAPWRYRGMMD
jgi:cell wall-associated NlpC family hydrolase